MKYTIKADSKFVYIIDESGEEAGRYLASKMARICDFEGTHEEYHVNEWTVRPSRTGTGLTYMLVENKQAWAWFKSKNACNDFLNEMHALC